MRKLEWCGYHMVKKVRLVKPFQYNTDEWTWQTDGQTDRTAISRSHISSDVLMHDKKLKLTVNNISRAYQSHTKYPTWSIYGPASNKRLSCCRKNARAYIMHVWSNYLITQKVEYTTIRFVGYCHIKFVLQTGVPGQPDSNKKRS